MPVGPALVVAASIVLAWLVTTPVGARLAFSVLVLLVLMGLAFFTPRYGLLALVVWLVALGLLRRVATLLTFAPHSDPLLLVGPLTFCVLVVVAARTEGFAHSTQLARGVLCLSALTLIGAVNPLQGSILAGISGLLFVLVPTLAFWIGRVLCDDRTLRQIMVVFAMLAIPTAVYGLWQTLDGFPRWDAAWVKQTELDYLALRVGGVVRPFSTFSAASEYGYFLGVAIVIWVIFGLRARRWVLTSTVVALLVTALIYQSSRTAIVTSTAALGVAYAAKRRLSLLISVAIAVLLLTLVSFGASQFVPSHTATQGRHSALVAHQVSGLADPLNPTSSTLLTHLTLMWDGLKSGVANPLGVGLGAVTVAGKKFGTVVQSTEADPSNVGIALGIPGLVAYIYVLLVGFKLAYNRTRQRGDVLAMAAFAILVVMLFQWLNGGQYSIAYLPWLILGWFDRAAEVDEPLPP